MPPQPQSASAPRYVQLPNGSYLEWPQGISPDEFKAKALKVMGQSNMPHMAADRSSRPPQTESEKYSRGYAGPGDEQRDSGPFFERMTEQAGRSLNSPSNFIPSWKALFPPLAFMDQARGEYRAMQDEASGKPKPKPDPAKKLGDLAPMILSALVTHAADAIPGPRGVNTIEPAVASRQLTDAVNPPPEQMAGFEKSLSEHLDKVVTFASKKGIKLDSPENLGLAMKEASTQIRTHYYDKILGPFKGVKADVTSVPGYSGETGGTPSSATLGQLDARLSQINAEMKSKFNKPTESAVRAAVKSDAELNAEAAGIRKVLYSDLGKASGLSPEVIAQTRQAFGALEGLAEKTTAAAMQSRSTANKAAQEPITLNPLSNTKSFVADKAVNKLRGNPVENAVKRAMSKANVKPYELPKPNPAAAAKATRSAPIRAESEPIGKLAEPSAAERSVVKDRVATRAAGNAKAQAAERLKRSTRSARHPFWQGDQE